MSTGLMLKKLLGDWVIGLLVNWVYYENRTTDNLQEVANLPHVKKLNK